MQRAWHATVYRSTLDGAVGRWALRRSDLRRRARRRASYRDQLLVVPRLTRSRPNSLRQARRFADIDGVLQSLLLTRSEDGASTRDVNDGGGGKIGRAHV